MQTVSTTQQEIDAAVGFLLSESFKNYDVYVIINRIIGEGQSNARVVIETLKYFIRLAEDRRILLSVHTQEHQP